MRSRKVLSNFLIHPTAQLVEDYTLNTNNSGLSRSDVRHTHSQCGWSAVRGRDPQRAGEVDDWCGASPVIRAGKTLGLNSAEHQALRNEDGR